MGKEYWAAWAKAAIVRAIKTFAQVFVALVGTGVVAFNEVNWVYIISASGVAFLLSIMTSLAGLPEVEKPAMEVPKGEAEEQGTISAAIEPPAQRDE